MALGMMGPAVLTGYRKDFRLERRRVIRIARRDVVEFCDEVLELGKSLVRQGRTDEAADLFRIGCESLTLSFGTILDEGYLADECLRRAENEGSAAEKVRILEGCVKRIRKTTDFKPIMEAEMPQGFPEPSAPELLRTKHYPAFRMVRAPVTPGRLRDSFRAIHRHLKENWIHPTVPAIMQLEATSAEQGHSVVREIFAGFGYYEPAEGPALRKGQLEVLDVPAMTVVSIAGKGGYSSKHYTRALCELEAWLSKHGDEFERAGPMRVLAYNSPFIPSFMKYYEVQIPVRPIGQ